MQEVRQSRRLSSARSCTAAHANAYQLLGGVVKSMNAKVACTAEERGLARALVLTDFCASWAAVHREDGREGHGPGPGPGPGRRGAGRLPSPAGGAVPAVYNFRSACHAGKQQNPSFALAVALAPVVCARVLKSAAAGLRRPARIRRWRVRRAAAAGAAPFCVTGGPHYATSPAVLWAHDCGLRAGFHGPAGLRRAAHAGLRRRAPAGALQAHRTLERRHAPSVHACMRSCTLRSAHPSARGGARLERR